MKKLLITLPLLTSFVGYSQVGINTTTPSAAFDILSKGNTNATKALEINDNTNKELIGVSDIGAVRLENYKNIAFLGTDANGNLKAGDALNIPSLATIASGIPSATYVGGSYNIVYFTLDKNDPNNISYDTTNGKFTINKTGYYSITLYSYLDVSMNNPSGGTAFAQINTGTTPSTLLAQSVSNYSDGSEKVCQTTSFTQKFNINDKFVVETRFTRPSKLVKASINVVYYGQ